MMFVVPESCKEWLDRQVTQYHDGPVALAEVSLREAAAFVGHLPEQPPSTVIDIGCGLGRASVMLHWIYGRPADTCYNMLDCGGRLSQKLVGGWRPDHPEWCNNFASTRQFMRANGVESDRIHTCDIGWQPGNVAQAMAMAGVRPDIVISLLAVGFHWPLEEWLDRLLPLCSPSTVFIFGVRRGQYIAKTFRPRFSYAGVVGTGWKEDMLILSGARQAVADGAIE